ncbi:MAG: GNAT family N-acetyltransferase [Bacteroidetes bacterium]|nr:GNAT family N-acetyltransferase [Bacteroidota bacterium]
MELVPIKAQIEDNKEFINDPLCKESICMSVDFYQRVGFVPPWIGYYVKQNGHYIAAAGFKGPPVNGAIEISYGVFEPYQQKGVGTAVCKLLVDLSLKTDPSVKITARTLPENNFSTRILEKNNFEFAGEINDPDDGEVWEWVYRK